MTVMPWPGYAGFTAGSALPRTLVMVGPDSEYHLNALLTAQTLGEDGGLPLGEMRVLSNVPNTETCQAVARRFQLDYSFQPAGRQRYIENDPSRGMTPERLAHMDWVAAQWTSFQPDLVVLAKYMVVLEPEVLDLLPWRVINIHHGILPAFQGRYALAAAVQAGTDFTGATCHFATAVLDQGPIIHQVAFPIDRHADTYTGEVTDVVARDIPCMKEAETIALLEGLGFYLRGQLELVRNDGLGKAQVPEEMRKDYRVRQRGHHGIDTSRFGDFNFLRAAWKFYFARTGLL